jgi:hypothetical protein
MPSRRSVIIPRYSRDIPRPKRTALGNTASFWFALSVAVITLFSVAEDAAAVIAAYVLFGGVGLVIARRVDKFAARIFIVVFGVATVGAVALFFHYINLYGIPYWATGTDELSYERYGRIFADSYSIFDYSEFRRTPILVGHNSFGYVYLIGILTKFGRIFGRDHTMVPRLFNAACLGLIAVMVYRLGGRLMLRKATAIAAGLFAGCIPLMMWVAVQTLRDVVIAMLLVSVASVWTADRDQTGVVSRQSTWVGLVVTLLAIVTLVDLRLGQAFIALFIAAVALLTNANGRRGMGWTFWILGIGGMVILFYMQNSESIGRDIEFLMEQRESYAKYRVQTVGGGLSTVVFETPPPIGYVLRIAYALITPIPVLSSKIYLLWISMGTIIHILFLPFLFGGLFLARRYMYWWTTLSAFLMLFIGMAIFTFQGRHIVQYLPFAVLLSALGYERYWYQRHIIFVAMGGLGILLAMTYSALKL